MKTTLQSSTNSIVTREISWETGVVNALFKTKISAVGQPTTFIYFDSNGKEIRKTTECFGASGPKTVVKTKEYNINGLLSKESLPYYEVGGGSIKYTNYTYNQFGQTSTIITNGLGVNKIEYNGRSTKTTDQAGKINTKVVNSLGKIISSTDNNSKSVTYKYNNVLAVKETNAVGVITKIGYDIYGRQNSLNEPNVGITTYKYDSYGRLTEQQDPTYLSKFNYDLLDRLTSKVIGDETITYSYISTGNGLNNVSSIISSKGGSTNYEYNNLGQITKITEAGSGETFVTEYVYDAEGKELKHIYPTQFATENIYDNIGNVIKVIRSDNKESIWELNEVTALGQIAKYTLGKSGKNVINYFDANNNILQSSTEVIINNTPSTIGQWYTIDGNTRNLLSRTINSVFEAFSYDNLDRLSSISFNSPTNGAPIYMSYTPEGNGNLGSKSDVGTYNYDSKPHTLGAITNQAANYPANYQSIVYNAFGKVISIGEGSNIFSFNYGATHERNKMTYINTANPGTNYIRYYASSFEKTVYNNNIKQVHYINTPMGATAVYIKDNTVNNDKIFHLIADYQGTITNIVSESGVLIESNSYDAWGRKRNYNVTTGILDYNNVTYALLSRGYTGHEMLLEVGLINMNGRLYDPLLGRMLSPDNFVQDPENTQSYNKFAYCFNNPLKYTDPSGQIAVVDDILIAAAVAAVISAATYTVNVAVSPGGFSNWNWMQFGFQTVVGGIVGGMTFGVGEGAAESLSYLSGYMSVTTAQIVVGTGQVLAHGVIQGVMNIGNGGTFAQGFYSGAASSAISSIMGNKLGTGGMILAGGLAGGVANSISGGDFMRGFVEGLIVSALNHGMHGASEKPTVEELLMKLTTLEEGNSMTGKEIGEFMGSKLVSTMIDNVTRVDKVNYKLKLTWAGNVALFKSKLDFSSDDLFQITNTKVTFKGQTFHTMRISSSGATLYDKPVSLYVNDNNYSLFGCIYKSTVSSLIFGN